MGSLIFPAVVGGFFVIVLLWAVGAYNRLVRRRIDTENGWSQIDVQLLRRYDLIPNLIETVKGYAAHEKETLEAVISARTRASGISSDAGHAGEKGMAEGMLTQALGRLFAVAEAYPDLKANDSFTRLQEELASTENKISFARQHFNDTVGRYEEARETFPSNLIASSFNFKEIEFFEIDVPEAREVPKVSFA